MITDAHAHLIMHLAGTAGGGELAAIGNGRVSMLDGTTMQIIPPEYGDTHFEADTLVQLMDEAGIGKAALIQGYLYGVCNEYICNAVRKYPDKFVGMGAFDPYIARNEQVLTRLIDGFGFRILKFEISEGSGLCGFHPDFCIDGELMQSIYRRAERDNIAIVFDIGQRGMRSFQVDGLIRTANTWKGVDFVVCHLLAPTSTDELEWWPHEMEKLAQCENLSFDISATPWNIREAYPYPSSVKFIAKARDIVGSHRLIWGSDAPLLLTISSYRRLYDFLEVSNEFTASELELILDKNAQRLYWR